METLETLHRKIQAGEYDLLPYHRPHFVNCSCGGLFSSSSKFCPSCGVRTDAAIKRSDEMLTERAIKNAATEDRFELDAIEAVGLSGHPKALAAFDLALGKTESFDSPTKQRSDIVKALIEYASLLLDD